jgi:hypothetical protein
VYCPDCGQQNPYESRSCVGCGSPIQQRVGDAPQNALVTWAKWGLVIVGSAVLVVLLLRLAVPSLFDFRSSDSKHISAEGGGREQGPSARASERYNVQKPSIEEAWTVGVRPQLEPSTTATNTWTGLPRKSDGTAIRIDGVDWDLTGHLRLGGPSTTFDFYCWDATGKVVRHYESHPCP